MRLCKSGRPYIRCISFPFPFCTFLRRAGYPFFRPERWIPCTAPMSSERSPQKKTAYISAPSRRENALSPLSSIQGTRCSSVTRRVSGIAIINKTCGMGENRTRLVVLYVVVFEDKHMIDAWSRSWTSVGTGGACEAI